MQLAEIASVEVILILVAVGLIVFGSAKIPKIARGLGSAKNEFERGIKEGDASASLADPDVIEDAPGVGLAVGGLGMAVAHVGQHILNDAANHARAWRSRSSW